MPSLVNQSIEQREYQHEFWVGKSISEEPGQHALRDRNLLAVLYPYCRRASKCHGSLSIAFEHAIRALFDGP